MRKQEFLDALARGLADVPQEGIAERLNFYSEMIDDRVEEGLSEEDAVAAMGSVDEIIGRDRGESCAEERALPTPKPRKERRRLRAWEIVLICVGSPIWFSLGVAAFAVLISLYAVLWSLVAATWAVFAAFAAGSVGGLAVSVVRIVLGDAPQGIALIGASLALAGLAIFVFFGALAAVKGIVRLTVLVCRAIGRCFGRRECEK